MHNKAWLAQIVEEPLEPDLPICDPHHHLWDYPESHPESRYLLDELLADLNTGHCLVSTVFVECNAMFNADLPEHLAPVGETEFVQGIAAMSSSGMYGDCRVASGIVSYADLCRGEEVRQVLEAHLRASPNRFKGIRHAASWHSSPDIKNSHANPNEHMLLSDNFLAGFAVLADMGLSFDCWCYHTQLQDVASLAKQVPEGTIILDHFGGPLGIGPYEGQQDAVFQAWRDSIEQLQALPNVYFKLGGINMKLNGFDWHKRDLPPTSDELVDKTAAYYEHCINTFGVERCMFESNFPVDRESVSYGVLWNAFKKMTASLTCAERAALFHDTATRVYRLG